MAEHQTLTISKLSPLGEGIAYTDTSEVYIPYALPGEVFEVEVGEPFARGSKRCPGKVIKLLQAAAERVEQVPCEHFEQCGGCQLMHVQYASQLELKQKDLKQAIVKALEHLPESKDKEQLRADVMGKLQSVEGMPESKLSACRFKSIRYFAQTNEGLKSGFFAPRSHNLVPISHCYLEPEIFSSIALELTSLLEQSACVAYSSMSELKQGIANVESTSDMSTSFMSKSDATQVRALVLRAGDNNQLLMYLIVASAVSAELKLKLQEFAKTHQITSFYIGYNQREGNALFTDKLELVYGEPWITKTILDNHYKIGPNTFLQVNYEMCEKLYAAAVGHCVQNAQEQTHSLEPASVALDLCCGVGTMSLVLAQHFKHVIGVDIVEDSIKAAYENALANGKEVSFIAGDLGKVLPSLIKPYDKKRVQAVISDPARVGIGEENARLLSKIKGPCKISLIYCALNALQRELPIFLKGGFKVEKIQGFDMFPYSKHIETLVCLSKD